jgi:hypothetical protein
MKIVYLGDFYFFNGVIVQGQHAEPHYYPAYGDGGSI